MPFEMICASVQGASHMRKSIPCEDYGMKYKNDYCCVFVLGDGHGDTNCPRSSIGSEYICRITLECLEEFEKNIRECEWTEKLFDPKSAEELIRQLIKSIIGKWTEKVSEEYASYPLSEEELSRLSDGYAQAYRSGQRIVHMYGTTLIAGLLTDRYLLLIQQGDGRCVVFDKNGEPLQPIPWDEKCIANITTSVCDMDAVSRCRYKVIDLLDSPVIACFLGSDGVEDSFSSFDTMYSFYRQLVKHICEEGTAETEKYLMGYLPGFSAKGSADDTTLCGIIDIQAAKDKLEKMSLDSEIVSVREAMINAGKRIPQMEEKLNYLKSQCEKIRAQLSKFQKELGEDKLLLDIKSMNEKRSIDKKRYQEAIKDCCSIERELSQVKTEHCRFREAEKGNNISIWENRRSFLEAELSKKKTEVDQLISTIELIDKKVASIRSSLSENNRILKTRFYEVEKEYTEYHRKYEEIVSIKKVSEKRLSELTGKRNYE